MTCRRKIPSWLTVLILASLGISVSPHRGLTRTSEVSRALSPVFSSYRVIRMEPGEIERQIRTTGELRFRFNETDFYFNLEPHDLRAPNYRAVEVGPGGVRRTLPPQPVHTFKGVLAGREDTRGRFNLTDGGVEGVVYAPEGWVYLEPLRNYLPGARAGDLVVYSQADIKPGEALKCEVSLAGRLERGVNRITAQATFGTPTNYVAEVATDADYEYVQALGGSEAAIREILGIMNQVEGVYQSELLLQLRISFQHAWDMEDPFNKTDKGALLKDFRDYWNFRYAGNQVYDLAHLWTGKRLDVNGTAYRGVVCRDRSFSYSLSTRQTGIPSKYALAAHEIGHNFGATHPHEQIPPVAGCYHTIMHTSSAPGPGWTFCEFSRQEIASHLSGYNSCLTPEPITLQPPSDLTAAAVSASGIGLSWRDRSTNESGFRVHRRPDEGNDWVEIGATAANATRYSDGGLFPGETYRYRVQAFNDNESSAFSNEAEAKTLEGPITGGQWRIYTIAGGGLGDNGPAVEARLLYPNALAADSAGNLFIADTENHRIRRVDPQGVITTVAGIGTEDEDGAGYGGDGGPAVAARLDFPRGVAVDSSGNLYIADWGNRRIRRVDRSGTITTVAGTGVGGYSGDGGPATRAALSGMWSIAVDGAGNLFIADTGNHRIRRVDRSGTITTVAGTGARGYGGDGGPAVAARLESPQGVVVDGAGNLFISDNLNHRIRRVDASGTITTVAGTGVQGYSGDGGPATRARMAGPQGVAVDSAGNLFIALGSRIRRVDASGIITTVAGTGRQGDGGDGGPAVEARMTHARGVAVGGAGDLYIADTFNHRIRRVDASGMIATIAGGGSGGDGGPAVEARLNRPKKMALDRAGNLYIADSSSHRVRRVDATGTITTVVGTGEAGYSGDNGPAVHAMVNWPTGVAVDSAGNLFISDTRNHRVRRVDPSGFVNTVAGTGVLGSVGDGGPAVAARLTYPYDLAVDGAGNLYVAERNTHRIRRVDATGTIATIAGTGEWGFSGDGGPAVEAQLSFVDDVALDGAGNLYIADTLNDRIRRVDRHGIITTIAGLEVRGFSGDGGPARRASLDYPAGLAVDAGGNLFIADTHNHRIRRVDSAGNISTIAGPRRNVRNYSGFRGDGGPAGDALLRRPEGVAADAVGNVYVVDTGNDRVRILTRTPAPRIPPAPAGLTATAVSSSRIDLTWRDNSPNETGFRVQRRLEGADVWNEIGVAAANATEFSDVRVKPTTSYHYRVSAFHYAGTSAFSNVAAATTPELMPPTLILFVPARGPAGTRVVLTGTHFLGATDVRFNGVSATGFEVLSTTSIEAVVPPDATSGPISVVAPGGTAVSAEPFAVTTGIGSRLFVPVVLRSRGRTPGSLFTSELTLANRGLTTAEIHYTYRAAFGGGSGTAVDFLEAGRQRIVPDAIAYLASLGVPLGEGAAGGTLAVEFSNLSSESDAAVTVRTSTPVEGGAGQAGLAYVGVPPTGLLAGTAVVAGLRQNRMDRSNLAVQHAGEASEGKITLRATVYSGDPDVPGSLVLPERSLPPGGFHQYNEILTEAGFDNGYVKVERVSGTAPYYAYGVINDNFNSDGSFVFPVAEESLRGTRGQTLPVIVETGDFASELTVTNFSSSEKQVDFTLVADAIETDGAATFSLRLEAGEQSILPDFVDHLRKQGVAGIGLPGRTVAGALFARVAEGDMSGIVIGARTGSPGGGGQYGVFYNAAPEGSAWTGSAWIYGLQRNATNRSNLALVNTGEVDNGRSLFSLDIYDGETGRLVKTVTTKAIAARGWHQINGVLRDHAPGTRQGYVQVRKLSGSNPFLAYGVVNDGGAPGERSGDGAYLPSQ